jgi:large subunit ribosomal protein L29
MKAKELREFSDTELESKIRELRKDLFNMRFKARVGQLEKPSQIRAARKDIARALTVAHGKKSQAMKEGAHASRAK